MVDRAFHCQLSGKSLTTAEIMYHMPDHPSLLQAFIWQDYDLAPEFPRLCSFLDFWARNLDGALSSVRVAHREMVQPADYRFVEGSLILH